MPIGPTIRSVNVALDGAFAGMLSSPHPFQRLLSPSDSEPEAAAAEIKSVVTDVGITTIPFSYEPASGGAASLASDSPPPNARMPAERDSEPVMITDHSRAPIALVYSPPVSLPQPTLLESTPASGADGITPGVGRAATFAQPPVSLPQPSFLETSTPDRKAARSGIGQTPALTEPPVSLPQPGLLEPAADASGETPKPTVGRKVNLTSPPVSLPQPSFLDPVAAQATPVPKTGHMPLLREPPVSLPHPAASNLDSAPGAETQATAIGKAAVLAPPPVSLPQPPHLSAAPGAGRAARFTTPPVSLPRAFPLDGSVDSPIEALDAGKAAALAPPPVSLPQPLLSETLPAIDLAPPLDAESAPAELAAEAQLDLAHEGEWLDRLARDIARSAAKDGAPLRFRLNPETLGHLQVELSQGGNGATIRLTAETEAARAIIADAQPRLIAEARAQGVRIAETHVDLSAGAGGGSGESNRRNEAERAPDFRTARLLHEEAQGDGKPSPRSSERYA